MANELSTRYYFWIWSFDEWVQLGRSNGYSQLDHLKQDCKFNIEVAEREGGKWKILKAEVFAKKE